MLADVARLRPETAVVRLKQREVAAHDSDATASLQRGVINDLRLKVFFDRVPRAQ